MPIEAHAGLVLRIHALPNLQNRNPSQVGMEHQMSACYECHGEGFKHGCCDDMCRGSVEAEDCPNRYLCRVCRGDGELWNEDDDLQEQHDTERSPN